MIVLFDDLESSRITSLIAPKIVIVAVEKTTKINTVYAEIIGQVVCINPFKINSEVSRNRRAVFHGSQYELSCYRPMILLSN